MAIKITDESGTVVDDNIHQFKGKGELIPKEATIEVPLSLVLLMKNLHDGVSVCRNNEYSLLFNAKREDETLNFTIDTDSVYIPKQSVTPGHIDYLNPEEVQEYNGVVHRHPTGVRKFSGTDDKYLNSLFEVSFIFIPPYDLPDAVVTINLDKAAKIQVKATCVIKDDVGEIPTRFNAKLGGFRPDDEAIHEVLSDYYIHLEDQMDDIGNIIVQPTRPMLGNVKMSNQRNLPISSTTQYGNYPVNKAQPNAHHHSRPALLSPDLLQLSAEELEELMDEDDGFGDNFDDEISLEEMFRRKMAFAY